MGTLSSSLIKAAVAAGGLALFAVLVVAVIVATGNSPDDDELLADAFADHPTKVIVGEGTATVWATAPDFRADPRPGGDPDPDLCRVTGEGQPTLVEPDRTDTRDLGDSTLYPIAQVEDYSPPMQVTCSGGSIDHVYVMGSSGSD